MPVNVCVAMPIPTRCPFETWLADLRVWQRGGGPREAPGSRDGQAKNPRRSGASQGEYRSPPKVSDRGCSLDDPRSRCSQAAAVHRELGLRLPTRKGRQAEAPTPSVSFLPPLVPVTKRRVKTTTLQAQSPKVLAALEAQNETPSCKGTVHGTAQALVEACISIHTGKYQRRRATAAAAAASPDGGRAASGTGPYSEFEAGHGVRPFEATVFRGGYTPQVPPPVSGHLTRQAESRFLGPPARSLRAPFKHVKPSAAARKPCPDTGRGPIASPSTLPSSAKRCTWSARAKEVVAGSDAALRVRSRWSSRGGSTPSLSRFKRILG